MKCIIENCNNDSARRGLCSKCLGHARNLVENGIVTWPQLVDHGMEREKEEDKFLTAAKKQFPALHIADIDKKRGVAMAAPKKNKVTPATGLNEFEARVKSVLWRQDGAEKVQYNAWKARVCELCSTEGGGYNRKQAVVQASKDHKCLTRLFREYDLSEFDPNPGSHPAIPTYGCAKEVRVVSEGKDLSYRESLRWAIEAAGAFLRTEIAPVSCPCDAAWYLYRQAIEEPKDFLGKLGQMESKGDIDSADKKNARKQVQKNISEIDRMLSEIEENANGEAKG